MTKLIINADDFGITESCTRAIFDAFEQNLITDVSMAVNCDAFDLAVGLAKGHEIGKNIGIHFNLTEGAPLTEKIRQYPAFVRDGVFHGQVNRLRPLSRGEKQAVYEELNAQYAKFEKTGIGMTHADSHYHIHTGIFIAPVVVRVCREHGIGKLRLHPTIAKLPLIKKIVRKSYNRWLHMKGFRTADFFGPLEDLKCGIPEGILEIMVHPDYDKDGVLTDRSCMKDGYPAGERLDVLSGFRKEDFFSYKEL